MTRTAVAALLLLALGAATADAKVAIRVTSNRADLVSGGDARVVVTGPRKLRITLGGRNVTKRFTRTGRRREAILRGLRVGRNVVRARTRAGAGARLVITNHPQGGPVFAGPQIQPWKCQETAVDRQCNQPPEFRFVYRSSDPSKKGFQPYDPEAPPADVATTTTENGKTVPFVVRVETGYQDRDQYKVATLFDPEQPWSGMKPQEQFNHKLLITHGASCDVDYEPGGAPSVTSYNPAAIVDVPVDPSGVLGDSALYALGRGFVVMSTALNNTGHNCDVVRGAESLVMAKEHVIERYGSLRYTIGTGCSGGSLAQQWIANAYPGIYEGILPTCSFPDTWSTATQVLDYHLLRLYFEDSTKWGPGVAWLPTQVASVEGSVTPVNAIVSDAGYFSAFIATHPCGGVDDDERYDPVNRPGGVRCSIADLAINVFGPRRRAVWTASETAVGHGFAGVPVDNVGVQYGLAALKSGELSPAQFADLNARVGGVDLDINPIPERIVADRPALGRAYRSGMINEANNLDRTAIIDCRGPDPGAAHDSYRAFALRARLDREHGDHDNQLIFEGAAPLIGDAQCNVLSLQAMERWLDAVRADRSKLPFAEKLVADKPADLGDACFSGSGQKLTDGLCPDAVVPIYGTPRTVAGDALTTDNQKCRLEPLARDAYPVAFTDAQWATLQQTFPDGVCDFSKPGVDQQPTVPWMHYGTAKKVVYGGRPLGQAPRHKRLPRRG